MKQKEQKYLVDFDLIERYLKMKNITKKTLCAAVKQTPSWYSHRKTKQDGMTEKEVKAINAVLGTHYKWTYLLSEESQIDYMTKHNMINTTLINAITEDAVEKEAESTNKPIIQTNISTLDMANEIGGNSRFIRIIETLYHSPDPDVDIRDELVRVADVIKVYKGEGKEGTTIHFDVLEHHRDLSVSRRQYISDFPSTLARDNEYEKLVIKLTK